MILSWLSARHGSCLLAALVTMLAAHASANGATGEPVGSSFRPTADVSLHGNGELHGQILDPQGRPLALAEVAILQQQRLVGRARTDVTGRFAIGGLKPGAYQLQSAAGVQAVRIWASQTAPPAAKQAVLLVSDGQAARAQMNYRAYGPAIRGAIAGGLVTGLTYWAIDHNDDDAS